MIDSSHRRLSEMDRMLSRDPVLSMVAELFPAPALPAVALLVACVVVGGALHSAVIALAGLALPVALGVGCYYAIRSRRNVEHAGVRPQ
jgi:hypothetical protein